MFTALFGGAERQRKRAVAHATGPLKDFYSGPWPEPHTPAAELRLLAIDLETTGLDPRDDQALSVGFVPVDGPEILLAGARHRIIHAPAEVGQSAVLHGLTDDVIATGRPMADVLAEILVALRGRILLAHFATIETRFLSAACEKHFGAPLVLPKIDTLELHRRLLSQGFDDEPRGSDLRLWNARLRYGLPAYTAHEALTDAMACAELYLAQVAELSSLKRQTYKSLRAD